MGENAILTATDKKILRGEIDEETYKDYSNRISKIRTRVRKRSEALVDEIQLLNQSGEEEVVDKILNEILTEVDHDTGKNLDGELRQLERDLQEVEDMCDEIPLIRSRLERLKEELDEEPIS